MELYKLFGMLFAPHGKERVGWTAGFLAIFCGVCD